MVPISVNVIASEDIPPPRIKRNKDGVKSTVNISQNVTIS